MLIATLGIAGCGSSTPADPPLSDGSCTMTQLSVPNEGWGHVAEGTPVSYRHNPPASGPHYPVWARYEAFSVAVGRGYWVHNLEHGAIVFLHRPDAPAAAVQALRAAYDSLPNDPACGHKRALLTPDPLLDRPVAVVAADAALVGECVAAASMASFATGRRARGPENVCAPGTRP